MKLKSTMMVAALLLGACATQPITTQLAGKSPAQQTKILVKECNDESGTGHDSSSRRRDHRYKDDNLAHKEAVNKICADLAKPATDKTSLITQCKVEAKNASYGNEWRYNTHVKRLTEICEAFAEIRT